MRVPTYTNQVDTNIPQSNISNVLVVNNNNNGYNTNIDDNAIVNITKEDNNNNCKKNNSSYINYGITIDSPNNQYHNVKDKHYHNINGPDYTKCYFNFLESGVDSNRIILTTNHTFLITVLSPSTVPKNIN